MKKILISLLLTACSSAPEDIGKQNQNWDNQCYQVQVAPITDDGLCTNLVHFWCKDGDNQYTYIPALASDWIGTTCYKDETNTYVYVCMVDDQNTAVVRCNK